MARGHYQRGYPRELARGPLSRGKAENLGARGSIFLRFFFFFFFFFLHIKFSLIKISIFFFFFFFFFFLKKKIYKTLTVQSTNIGFKSGARIIELLVVV